MIPLIRLLVVAIVFLNFTFYLQPDDIQKEKHKGNLKTINVEVYFCDNRQLTGKIELNVPETITIIHEVNNIEFTKEVSFEEISTITFLGWTPELIEVKKDKGKIYKFLVSNYSIELKDSLILKIKKPLPEYFEKFTFKNKFGKVILYTYWIDLLQNNNTWYTGLTGPETGERIFCHQDVIKKIIFQKKENKR